ncbi:MAG: hypothetical protein KKE02_22595 [Alphaproteobacteria bacterium]|nr:hypothetical protein [Alphaproteobacteria bacterium]MBU1516425.1 hypothetical protein [Alphaproteobacteria bacterium]MBU2093338.1 hypothetical protein [Alphaproteobacteria bacterium]MBU2153825.1 hypothetical protein [Alphaproteobacteria bacterium]MBU2307697.1 hypothetical protein [Alphaproteobacteria bacterium]
MRMGFLFNHDQVHQVAHSLPIALALARGGTGAEIVVATTNPRLSAEVIRLGEGLIGPAIRLVELGLKRRSSRLAKGALEAMVPATKLLIYGDNLDFFRSLDVLVVAEKTSLILKTRHGLKDLKIVHTRHGAGDRAIGFDKASAGFDHVLVSGRKIRDRLVAEAGVDPASISVVGYPKFDMSAGPGHVRPLIDDGRPVVLYNPHVSPHLSSWYAAGRQVLDWFVEHDDHHLIFAPHVMLFERPFVLTIDKLRVDRPGRIEERYLRAPNIHIDLGSRASTTMAYTNRADIYLGDASSQVYEFLLKPRPCVFLNPHRLPWKGDPNFAHWQAGPVIEDVEELGAALAQAQASHATTHRPIQQAMFDASFDLTEEPSAIRAARAVAVFAGLSAPGLAAPPQDTRRVAHG